MAVRRFAVVIKAGSPTRRRFVVQAAGPLAAAVDAFLQYNGRGSRATEADPPAALTQPRQFAATVSSGEGSRFRVRVTPEDQW